MPTWSIMRAALQQAPPDSRRTMNWLFAGSALVLVLQVWDVRNAGRAAGTAELLSVVAGVGGVVILSLTIVLGAGGAMMSESRDGADELTPVLRALPPFAFLSGILLSAGIAMFLARGLLGLHPVRVIVPAALQALALYAAWVTVRNTTALLFAHGARQAEHAAKARADLQEARFEALQARMQPHFLFNALNTVAALVKSDPDAAERTVEDLSAILRSTLARQGSTTWPMDDEIALVRSYVGVEQRRLGERLAMTWSVDPAALAVAVPVLSLQPLVENAIVHGIASRIDGGDISVVVTMSAGVLRMTVRDSGDGFAPGWKESVGLGNLRTRLASLYGARAELNVDPDPPTTVTVVIPAGSPA